jgi:glycerol-3-phosphate O-acyltransferase
MSYTQVDNLVIMTTSIIATVLLMHRKGISLDLLVERVVFIYEEILARKGLVQINIKPNAKIIQNCIKYLSDFVEQKRDFYEPLISAKNGEKSLLMLAYYRNNLAHLFINEAEISASLLGLLNKSD